ncbi:MAG: beta-ketoacyl-[acyl-carrier-protein] synthase family protein [Opitutales bacterium]|nr:beta-ketoacyl-[acyl-carrier-protein] synthase family protein [Opitutales bacterium]
MGARTVAITGIGWVSSIGCDEVTVRDSLRLGRSGIRSVKWPPGAEQSPVKVAGTVPEFDVSVPQWMRWQMPARHQIRREALRAFAPQGVYACCAVFDALADAGLEEAALADPETGLFCASVGSPLMMRHYLEQMSASRGARGHPLGVVSSIAGTLNFNLGAYFKIKGANLGFVSACASSSHALAYAMEEIRHGRQKRMVVVGAEEVTAETVVPFAAMRALSVQSGCDASRPFDRSRDGFVASGGAVALILEEGSLAQARGARARAFATGWGQASDGHNVAISHEEGDGLARSMMRALDDAGLSPGDIGHINAHATSTVIGDLSEARAIGRVFHDALDVPVSSTKALTGHALSMAGALEAGLACLALEEERVPRQWHLHEVDSGCAHLHLPREDLPLQRPNILTNSSGFGGSNVTLILSRSP